MFNFIAHKWGCGHCDGVSPFFPSTLCNYHLLFYILIEKRRNRLFNMTPIYMEELEYRIFHD